ncbi:phosphoserine phosphatase RsbU [Halolactibacillus alkaliphilus]|uniref:Phosphoserine phosphatase RsbU n=1 Tax=Halolactibacillus alkaliphilus TaxID=442899 RepID=A0A511X163_9BACI|nr:PP2C family protein-serine/threonine phosphatase [Halolactibacillus alkaliphilus]GEN56640.1 phosphoserine phosphatase RsbU [Halolactibacillus alkaliphilus]GGN69891.1 phosphoserine phosphatase RsbU [Halolactibacillus alkaliphilus]SFO75864.1 sigma-B regulation protein RsbU (phosphoserine phosphatase) [Halolactibacillus alkaliphilus]
MKKEKLDLEDYRKLLKQYLLTHDETALYQAEQLSKLSVQHNVSPEEIIHVHIEALKELYPNLQKEVSDSLNFLLEAMISYGLALQEYQSLREKQSALESEISVAANMQKTLLQTKKPTIKGLDIGAVSVPANQMNGDYYHFIEGADGTLGIALADVIGKGVPAALAMSMIKYSMDSFPEQLRQPAQILESLNRVVERNVDTSMFITMFYGLYNPVSQTFGFSSAGHEPGFFYFHETESFSEITARGLVLGATSDARYNEEIMTIAEGDAIILLTDGVTECHLGDRFIERDEVLEVIKHYLHLPAQEAVEKVYKHFERLQDFHLRDDFTLIILKKEN